MRINLKTLIHYLSFLLLVLSYLSLSFETALKSGVFSSYSDLFTPITHFFLLAKVCFAASACACFDYFFFC